MYLSIQKKMNDIRMNVKCIFKFICDKNILHHLHVLVYLKNLCVRKKIIEI